MVVFDRLWSGRAVTEHKYVFLFFVCVYMYVSNHFNHCIKLFAPCGPLIGNNKFLFLFLYCPGADPGFQVRGGQILKNCAERREARTNLGYFVWKITILCQKILFFQILGGGGGGRRMRAPPGSAPVVYINDNR